MKDILRSGCSLLGTNENRGSVKHGEITPQISQIVGTGIGNVVVN